MRKITEKTCLQGFNLLNLPAGICLLTCLQELLEIVLYLKINSGLIYIGNEQAFLIFSDMKTDHVEAALHKCSYKKVF